ncbi:hypothetical protein K3495_g307 [Podosphaera aphanis]|nr:hypothetical protein K3495_g307 [Podosphaera aphanis]
MPTAFSAPGKVLIAGGYLVLDRQYTGLVFGLSARIHVLIAERARDASASANQIVVRSPQFLDAVWEYTYSVRDGNKGVQVSQRATGAASLESRNPFVETTLTYVLTFLAAAAAAGLDHVALHPCEITILADTDYYSHASQPSPIYPRFPSFHVPLSAAHKTGLGSSAALVTALTAALLSHHLLTFNLSVASNRTKLHNLAQAAHCAAQGKVGSGFDVAAAVFGSCIYRRFSPHVLAGVSEPGSMDFAERLYALVEDAAGVWDVEIRKDCISLPPTWALVMCDVDCGSATVGMVKRLLSWRSSNPEPAREIWDELLQIQQQLVANFRANDAEAAHQSLERMRHQIRHMSALSSVPIEPPQQTALLDTVTKTVGGVIGGVVPGAGGYDAIVLLVKNERVVMDDLMAFFKTWNEQRCENVKLLSTMGADEGAKAENFQDYFTVT